MERREFLVGSGAILTAAFVTKAEWFLEHEKRVVPLIEETPSERVLYFVNNGFDFELRLDEPEVVLPEMTLREALENYHGVHVPDRPLRLSEWRELYHEHGVLPTALDKPADWDWVVDGWARTDSPNAKAYHKLEGLDLFHSDANGRYLGGLSFIDGFHPGNDYLGVRANDAITASLLQARLLELGETFRVELIS